MSTCGNATACRTQAKATSCGHAVASQIIAHLVSSVPGRPAATSSVPQSRRIDARWQCAGRSRSPGVGRQWRTRKVSRGRCTGNEQALAGDGPSEHTRTYGHATMLKCCEVETQATCAHSRRVDAARLLARVGCSLARWAARLLARVGWRCLRCWCWQARAEARRATCSRCAVCSRCSHASRLHVPHHARIIRMGS
jgi:hypothetical protein